MADLTKKERDAIAMRVAEAFATDKKAPAARGAPKLAAAQAARAAANPKRVLLSELAADPDRPRVAQDLRPPPIKPIVHLVIKAGDAVSSVICVAVVAGSGSPRARQPARSLARGDGRGAFAEIDAAHLAVGLDAAPRHADAAEEEGNAAGAMSSPSGVRNAASSPSHGPPKTARRSR